MEQTNNNFFKPPTQPNNLLTYNSFTPRSPHHQFIPTLVKLASLREYQRDSLTNFHHKLLDTQLTAKHKPTKGRQSKLESVAALQHLNLQTLSHRQIKNSNGKFIGKIKSCQPESTSHKKNYNSYLQKCRIVTESYDQLKKEVIKSKFPKSRHKCSSIYNGDENSQKINITGITNKYYQRFLSEKQNNMELQTTGGKVRHTRYKSYSESSKKSQRYMQISVAEFMEEQEHKISSGISKKFQQYQKQNEKHNKSLQENCGQTSPEQNVCYKVKNKKIQLPPNERLGYPIITHAF